MSCFVRRAGLLALAVSLDGASAALAQSRNLYTPPAPSQDQQPGYYTPPPAPYAGSASGFQARYANAQYNSGGYGYGGYGGYGYPGVGSRAGNTLQGASSYTQAQGNYNIQIQEAKLGREQAKQANIDTARKKVQWEMEYYEKYRPTAPKLAAETEKADLEWARNYAQSTEIWSGRTLNVLLKSVFKSPNATQGPQVSLDEKQLAGLNLTDGTTRGTLALAKDQGKIYWPEALQEEVFDGPRDSFEKNFAVASKTVEGGEQPNVKVLRGLRADLTKLEEKLLDEIKDLSPSKYIESKRLLNQLKDTVKGFSDARVCKSCSADWRKNVRTVGDLVAYCEKNGLVFGPAAAPGDYPSYTSTYYALRNYESGVRR